MTTRALLDKIQWQKPSKAAPSLTQARAEHAFLGRGDVMPEVHHARQVHGTRIVAATAAATAAKTSTRTEADAVFTLEPGTTVAVKTADCLPILVVAPGRAAMAIHAGWRGLTSGIIDDALTALGTVGVQAASLIAVVGPTISRERFEVGPEVVDAVLSVALGLSQEQAGYCLAKGHGDRWHVDLPVTAALALANTGIPPAQITVVQACTYSEQAWFSFRREGKGCGMNWSWVRFLA